MFDSSRSTSSRLAVDVLEDRTLLSNLAAAQSYLQLPLVFEANVGQTDSQVQYFARGQGYGLFLTPGEAVLSLTGADASAVLRAQIVGGNLGAAVSGLDRQSGMSNYFIGNDPSRWNTDVPLFGRVQYDNVYPGVDLVYYGTSQRELEYDFIVAPGADPGVIQVNYQGADSMRLDTDGNLVLHTSAGDVVQNAPVLYQEVDGARREVAGAFLLTGNELRFEVGSYDRSRPLIIDPVLGLLDGGSGTDVLNALSGWTYSLTGPNAGTLNGRNFKGVETRR